MQPKKFKNAIRASLGLLICVLWPNGSASVCSVFLRYRIIGVNNDTVGFGSNRTHCLWR